MSSNPPAPPDPRTTILIGLVFVGGAIWGYANIAQEIMRAQASPQWPTTEAHIVSSDLWKNDSTRGGRDTYTVEVEYTYNVGGQEYEGETIRFGGFPSVSSEELAREIAGRYPEARSVPVSYDPADPSRSVLEPGLGASISAISLGAFLLLFPLGLGMIPFINGIKALNASKQQG